MIFLLSAIGLKSCYAFTNNSWYIFFCFISEDGGLTKRGILIYFLIRFFCGTVRYARKQKYFKAEPTGVYYSIFSSNAGVVQKKEITQGRWE